jgi:predicted RNA-binding protein YlqC (UPF0109 family)
MAAATQPAPQIKVLIPKTSAGRVIGQQGAMIRTLSRMPDIFSVDVMDHENGYLSIVRISGRSTEAVQSVADRVHELGYRLPVALPITNDKNFPYEYASVPVPAETIPFLFGKNNEKMQDARATPGLTHIILMQNSDISRGFMVQIKGATAEIVREVEAEVNELLVTALAEAAEDSKLVTQVVPVPSSAAGFVIGKGGSVIKEMERMPNIKSVRYDRYKEQATIRGFSQAAVESVVRWVQAQLKLASAKAAGLPPPRVDLPPRSAARRPRSDDPKLARDFSKKPTSEWARNKQRDRRREYLKSNTFRPETHKSESRRQNGAPSKRAGAPKAGSSDDSSGLDDN